MVPDWFKNEVLPLKNKLFRFANSLLNDRDTALDVVQETMMKVWEKQQEMAVVRSTEAWCMTLTRNFALDKLRSKHYRTASLAPDHDRAWGISPYKMVETENMMQLVDKIVAGLSQKQKETFHLRDVEGYTYQEISEITGYSIPDVKVSIYRARKEIRTQLLKLEKHGFETSRSAG